MMTVVYFDTSALVKRYITELGSDWVSALLEDQSSTVFTSHLTVIEGVCTFARRQREGMLSSEDFHELVTVFDYDFAYHYNILDVEPVVIETARQLATRHPLRAYDAVQLATVWLLNQDLLRTNKPPITFVCADDRLLAIAQTEELLTDNPNQHA
jgi:predicted nucleic acid-binding protein